MRLLVGPAAWVLALCLLPSAAATSLQGGLHGYVRKGVITPVCPGDKPCDAPAAGVLLTFTGAHGVVSRTRTRPTGFYRVALQAGRYQVTADVGAGQHFSVKATRVMDKRDGRLDFFIDTGIQ